jgi:hypothetical protein
LFESGFKQTNYKKIFLRQLGKSEYGLGITGCQGTVKNFVSHESGVVAMLVTQCLCF